MARRRRHWIAVLAVVTAATIPGAALSAAPGDRAAEPRLVARAVLPADTFADGPPSGSAIGPGPINGRTPPFPTQPVQGFSALIGSGRAGVYLALADNGYGAKANSADFLLRAYRIRPRWERAGGGPGTVEVLGFVQFRDPDHRAAWPIVNQETDERLLTGADFDPESIRRAPDGTYWVGDEFGPFLLHFSAGGVLLEAPVPFPVPRRLSAYGGGQDEVRSPDNPALAGVQVKEVTESQAAPIKRYEPGHPLADAQGYVYAPDVDPVGQMVDMISASRSYQNNVDMMNTAKTLLLKTLTIGQ